MIILLIMKIISFIMIFYKLYCGKMVDVFIAIILFLIFTVIRSYFKLQIHKSQEFLDWLNKSRYDIENYEAFYKGIRITPDTQVVQYQVCLSLMFTVKLSFNYYIIKQNKNGVNRFIYSFISLILGWWALPWGPIYTLQVVFNNIRNNKKTTVKNLLDFDNSKQIIFQEGTYNI